MIHIFSRDGRKVRCLQFYWSWEAQYCLPSETQLQIQYRLLKVVATERS